MRTMIDLELDVLLQKKLGKKRSEREYIFPRQCGKPRLALRYFLKRFFERGGFKDEKSKSLEDLLCN